MMRKMQLGCAAVTALALGEGACALDLATRTADVALTIAARHPNVRVVGVDPSRGMLEIGRRSQERHRSRHRHPGAGAAVAVADQGQPERQRHLQADARVDRDHAARLGREREQPERGLDQAAPGCGEGGVGQCGYPTHREAASGQNGRHADPWARS